MLLGVIDTPIVGWFFHRTRYVVLKSDLDLKLYLQLNNFFDYSLNVIVTTIGHSFPMNQFLHVGFWYINIGTWNSWPHNLKKVEMLQESSYIWLFLKSFGDYCRLIQTSISNFQWFNIFSNSKPWNS